MRAGFPSGLRRMILASVLRSRAEGLFQQYRETGDPKLLSAYSSALREYEQLVPYGSRIKDYYGPREHDSGSQDINEYYGPTRYDQENLEPPVEGVNYRSRRK